MSEVSEAVEQSMTQRYGKDWRDVMALKMQNNLIESIETTLGYAIRDCEIWGPAGIDTQRVLDLVGDVRAIIDGYPS